MVFLNFTQLLYAFLVASNTKWPSILNDNAKPPDKYCSVKDHNTWVQSNFQKLWCFNVRLKMNPFSNISMGVHASMQRAHMCACVTMKKSARRMASTASNTGDTSSKQQQAQRKENVCVCVCVCVCARARARVCARVRVPVIDLWNGPLASILFYIFIYAQGKMDTETNFVICLGVRFALHVIKALRLARIEHCSRTVVTRFFFLHYYYYFLVALCLQVSLVSHVQLAIHHAHSLHCDTHTHARTHARTHTHTHTGTRKHVCLQLATGNSLPSAEALALTSSTKCWRVNVVKHQGTRSYVGNIIPLSGEEPLTIKKTWCFFFSFECGLDKKKTCKTTDGQHLLLKAYLLRRRLRFYGGSLWAPEGETTSHLRQPPQERSMSSARSLSPPQSCTGRKCHWIEYELLTFGWASAARQSSFMQFLDGLGAVRTLNELMEERSQRFDSSAHSQIHTEAVELNVLHVNTKHHSAALRRSTSKKN